MKAIPETYEKTPTFRVKPLCAWSSLVSFVFIIRVLSLIQLKELLLHAYNMEDTENEKT